MLWIFLCFPLVTWSSMEVLVISLFCILWSFVMLHASNSFKMDDNPLFKEIQLLSWIFHFMLELFFNDLSFEITLAIKNFMRPGRPAWSPFEIFLLRILYESLRVWSYWSLFRDLREAAVNPNSTNNSFPLQQFFK